MADDPQDQNRPADHVDPEQAAQFEQARKALDLKRQTPPDPRFGTEASNEGMRPTNVNDTANVEGSVEIGGQPEALSRSKGVRHSDQG